MDKVFSPQFPKLKRMVARMCSKCVSLHDDKTTVAGKVLQMPKGGNIISIKFNIKRNITNRQVITVMKGTALH